MKPSFVVCSLLLVGSTALNIGAFFVISRLYRRNLSLGLDPSQGAGIEAAPIGTGVQGEARVLFLGDSRIARWAVLPEVPGATCTNRGVGGSTTSQLLLRLEQDLADVRPDVVVLQVGINDLKAIPVFEQHGAAIERACVENIEVAVTAMLEAGARVVVLSVIPTGRAPVYRLPWWSGEVAAAVGRVNRGIGELTGEHVSVIDCAPLLVEDGRTRSEYLADFIHLNDAGYALLNEAVMGELIPFVGH